MGVAESFGAVTAPVLAILPARVQQRISVSLERGFVDYEARVAAGTQPETPGAYPDFMIVANAIYIAVTVILYIAMKKRAKGFEIKGIITVYNLTCVVAAGYCAVHIALYKYHHPGKFVCNETVEGEDGEWLAWVFWVFYAQKFWEFLDTWFFILRRSFRQVRVDREPASALTWMRLPASLSALTRVRATTGYVPTSVSPQLHHFGCWEYLALRLQRRYVLAHHVELHRPRAHVLSLLRHCAWNQDLCVQGIGNP